MTKLAPTKLFVIWTGKRTCRDWHAWQSPQLAISMKVGAFSFFQKNVFHALELHVKHVSHVLCCMFQSRHVEVTDMSMCLQLHFTRMAGGKPWAEPKSS